VKRFQSLAQTLTAAIHAGTFQPGERVPSVRRLCRQYHVSPATVQRAYEVLEAQGLIETRSRSGTYVSARRNDANRVRAAGSGAASRLLDSGERVFAMLTAMRDRRVVPLGSAFPGPALFPWARLSRYLGSSARQMDPLDTVQHLPPGDAGLRRQIARRYLTSGVAVEADEIVITAGAMEALTLSLRVLTRPGDTIAIESPTFYACLLAAESCGLKVIEVPVDPGTGIDLDALAHAIERHDIRACWFMTTLHNPTGATLSEERKRALIQLLRTRSIPLIEDDVYAELQFGAAVRPAKAFDSEGQVLHCGSFSKSLAPGYRLGWVAAGRHADAVQRAKAIATLGTSLPVQLAVARMLREGGFDAHLRRLRAALAAGQRRALAAVRAQWPGAQVLAPVGGYFLWVELPRTVDALEVHRRALDAGISIAPGPLFSARRGFGNCLRLNYGHAWTEGTTQAMTLIGRFIEEQRRITTRTKQRTGVTPRTAARR
jgi:DNA-binding transcriptional MocR family regulator